MAVHCLVELGLGLLNFSRDSGDRPLERGAVGGRGALGADGRERHWEQLNDKQQMHR